MRQLPIANSKTFHLKTSTDFSNDVGNTLGELDLGTMDLYQAVETFNNYLKSVLNKHAPVKSHTVKVTHKQPWFYDKIRSEIILRRKKE